MVVRVDFTRDGTRYRRGDFIVDPAQIAAIEGTDHHAHVGWTELPDDHHAVEAYYAAAAAEPAPAGAADEDRADRE